MTLKEAALIVTIVLLVVAFVTSVCYAIDRFTGATARQQPPQGLRFSYCIGGLVYSSAHQGPMYYWLVKDRGDGSGPETCSEETK